MMMVATRLASAARDTAPHRLSGRHARYAQRLAGKT